MVRIVTNVDMAQSRLRLLESKDLNSKFHRMVSNLNITCQRGKYRQRAVTKQGKGRNSHIPEKLAGHYNIFTESNIGVWCAVQSSEILFRVIIISNAVVACGTNGRSDRIVKLTYRLMFGAARVTSLQELTRLNPPSSWVERICCNFSSRYEPF